MNSSFRWSLIMTIAGCMLGAAVLSPPAHARHHERDLRSQRYYGRSSAPIFSTIRAVDARQRGAITRYAGTRRPIYRHSRWSSAPSFTTIRTVYGRRPFYRHRYGSVWQPAVVPFTTMRVAGARQYYGYAAPRRWRHRHRRH